MKRIKPTDGIEWIAFASVDALQSAITTVYMADVGDLQDFDDVIMEYLYDEAHQTR